MQILHFGSETPEQLTFVVEVYSSAGRKVKNFRADQTCSVADLSDGVYVVRWRCGGKNRSAKFLKQ
jgi:H2-forming N5,N10-methylenetetrahydromethanopterin dehydrogenase-like enzyme